MTFQFYLQLWKQRKVELVGDVSRVVFGEKGSVRQCAVMMQIQFFRHQVHTDAVRRHIVRRINNTQ
jgi:hypothetical protein